MKLPKNFLARLAGAQNDVLMKARTDRIKYNAMGGVLLTTAGMAGVSSAFALRTAVHLPLAVAIIAGLLWAVVIFNLDRMLIITMNRQSGWLRNLLTAVPRVLLAVVIGLVISVPLVLQIFQSEITSELQVIHANNLTSDARKLNNEFADIPAKQSQIDKLQAIASGQAQPSVSDDPDVVAAQNQVNQAQAAYYSAQANAQCELNGTCGTHHVGNGPVYQQAKTAADNAFAALTTAKNKLTDATARAKAKITGSVTSNKTAAQNQLKILVPQLQTREAQRTAAQNALVTTEDNSDGLLARINALGQLSSDNSAMNSASILLTLLFLLVEVLPVLVKLLSMVGPATLYDKLLDKEEDHLQNRATSQIDVEHELDEHGKAEQIRLGKEARTKLAAEQFEIAKKAIDTWAQIAKSRTDDELARWYARHAGPATVPLATQQHATPPQPTPPPPASWVTPPPAGPRPTPPPWTQPAGTAPPPTVASGTNTATSPQSAAPTQPFRPVGGSYQQFKAQTGVPGNNGYPTGGPTVSQP